MRYLAIFFLPVPHKEHANIEKAVAHYSDGDYRRAFLNANRDGSGVVGYLFSSNTIALADGLRAAQWRHPSHCRDW